LTSPAISCRRVCRAGDDVYAGPIDNATDPLRAMAATIWAEARGEPFEGKVATAWVIIIPVPPTGMVGRRHPLKLMLVRPSC
jgi:hypothetical protein